MTLSGVEQTQPHVLQDYCTSQESPLVSYQKFPCCARVQLWCLMHTEHDYTDDMSSR